MHIWVLRSSTQASSWSHINNTTINNLAIKRHWWQTSIDKQHTTYHIIKEEEDDHRTLEVVTFLVGVITMHHACFHICFNCHKPGHYARDCSLPSNPSSYQNRESSKKVEYANTSEFFDVHIAQNSHDPYYYWGNGPWALDSGVSKYIAFDRQKLD